MSLSIYLYGPEETKPCECSHCGNGHTKIEREELFEANITNNLYKMADEAGISQCLFNPEEVGIIKAYQVIAPLTHGLTKMKLNPEKYKAFDSTNGWGTYDQFIPWIERYLCACEEYPNAVISVS